jgi:predicted extracellular nuclease
MARRSPLAALAVLTLVSGLLGAGPAAAQVSLPAMNTAVTENFNSLVSTGTSSTVPAGWAFNEAGANANTTYTAGTGSGTAGDTYSFGAAASSERAFGGLQSGNLIPTLGAAFTNNTGGQITSLDIAYTGEQWRLGATGRTDRIDFQISTDATSLTTGTWTDIDALDFSSPITTGTVGALDGNAAANRAAVSATINSLAIANGATFWIRWTDFNPTGADDGLAVDDFSITPHGGPVPLSLSINNATVTEGDSGAQNALFTVSLTQPAPAGGVTFDIATQDNTATVADNDYVARSLNAQSIPEGQQTYTFAVVVNGDTNLEPDETFFVNVANVVGAPVNDGQGLGTILNDDGATFTRIHTIQGNGAASPLVGSSVTTRGIVTGVKSNGFFIQEPDATVDADPLTSEGITVFTSSAPPAAATVGNLVEVTGTVAEFVPSADPLQPPLTEITGPSVTVISTGNLLPSPIELTTTFPDPVGPHDQLERLESMRVSVPSLTVVGPTLGTVTETSATAVTTGVFYGVVTGVARPFREPGIPAPDPAPSGGGSIPPIPRFDSNPERIRVDTDGLVGGVARDAGTGAVVSGLVGPLDYSFRTYTVLPDPGLSLPITGGPTATAVTTAAGNELTVACFNIERFFDNTDDPSVGEPVLTAAAYDKRLNKASLAIRNFLRTPDILGVEEVENLATLQALATRINTDAVTAGQPNPQYAPYLSEGHDVGGIDVGFLVKTATVAGSTPRVSVAEVVQERADTLFVNPNATTSFLNDRPPLRFTGAVHHANGASFPVTVIVNHLRSLGDVNSEDPGSSGWSTDGARVRAKRQKQAEDLAGLVQDRQTAAPSEHIVLVGDFNAFEVNDGLVDSMHVIAGTPPPDNQTAVPGDGVDLVNPDLVNLVNTPPPAERYSYVFDGNAQNLDHILINAPLITDTTARRIEHPRIDADFPETARNDGTTAVRLSDHDPVVAYFRVAAFGGSTAGSFFTVTPCRLLDTRSGSPLTSDAPATLTVQGACGIPATAHAVALNVTVVGPTGQGDLTLYPSDQPRPTSSTLNFSGAQLRANNAVIALGADGKLKLYPFVLGSGSVHVLVDVSGYFE